MNHNMMNVNKIFKLQINSFLLINSVFRLENLKQKPINTFKYIFQIFEYINNDFILKSRKLNYYRIIKKKIKF